MSEDTTSNNVGPSEPEQPGVLRVFQSKDHRKSFYNKIARFYDLLAERSEQPMREAGLQKLAVGAGELVLEIGFGTGHISELWFTACRCVGR